MGRVEGASGIDDLDVEICSVLLQDDGKFCRGWAAAVLQYIGGYFRDADTGFEAHSFVDRPKTSDFVDPRVDRGDAFGIGPKSTFVDIRNYRSIRLGHSS